MTGAIYVDDTGNPGADSGSAFLPNSRKSWTAVIVPSVVSNDVAQAMEMFLAGVRSDFGADELHFTDIWSGRGVWASVDVPMRAEMIHLMADLMGAFSLPIVHQTVSTETLEDHPATFGGMLGRKVGDWRLDDLSHLGFLMLCSQTARHLRELVAEGDEAFGFPLPLYVDEGLLSAGLDRSLPNWSDVIAGPSALFRRSKDVPGIQMADFAAFIINRAQWEAVKRTPKPEFAMAEEVIFEAASRLNVLNLPRSMVSSAGLGPGFYGDAINQDRLEKGLKPRPGKL